MLPETMPPYRIFHDRPGCIGCGACAAIAPDFWEMDSDGKSNVIGGRRLESGQEERDIEEKDLDINKESAQSCPVNVIHLINKEKDEKII